MSDEQVVVAEEVKEIATETAPESTETASVEDSPVAGEGEQPETKETKPKTFTQEDVDRIVAKEKSRAARKAERDIQREIDQRIAEALKQNAPKQDAVQEAPTKPRPDQFATTEEYVEAVAEWKADLKVKSHFELTEKQRQEQMRQQHMQQVQQSYRKMEESAREKYEDFEEVAYNPSVPITPAMAATIQESEMGPDIAYYLGKNTQEADRIARLAPFLQAKELGKLEAKLASTVTPPKPSAAPAPIAPLKSPTASSAYVDTTDPRSAEKMSTSEWIEAERKRQMRKWEAAHR
jgi:hypothetical protein